MQIPSTSPWHDGGSLGPLPLPSSPPAAPPDELKQTFAAFVGESLFGQMIASMRKTVDAPAYFGGSQAEKIFQQQLDQTLVEKISEASADRIAEPMYELFRLGRNR